MTTFPLTLRSTASMHRWATYSVFSPVLFGSASRTGPASTADARKLPSIVEGRMKLKAMFRCSIASAWYSRSDAALDEAYKARVGAGMIAAADETRRIAGDDDVRVSIGICQELAMNPIILNVIIRTPHQSDRCNKWPLKITLHCTSRDLHCSAHSFCTGVTLHTRLPSKRHHRLQR